MSDTQIVADKDQRARIVRNYAFILFGLLFWPLLVVAHLRASRGRSSVNASERGHAVFQYQTSSVALLSGAVLLFVFLVLAFGFPPANALEMAHARMRNMLLINLGYCFSLWAAVRSIRGLYLASAGEALSRPTVLTIWPKIAE